jgi:uncharacterized surface protein with fasciclin (FAS1) repeats
MKTMITSIFISLALITSAYAECGGGGGGEKSQVHDRTIVGVASNAGTFKTLLAAAQAAGLAETLAGVGPYTVFAPTDEAFAKLPEGTLESLLADKEQLSQILLYHVVPGNLKAAEVVTNSSLKSAQGADITLTVNGSSVMVNNANVVATDIEASNGVIHVIDTVILPPARASRK